MARKQIEDTETAINQEQEDMRNPEKAGLTTRKPETTFEEMLNAIGDSLRELAISDNGEEGEDEDNDEEDPQLGKLTEDGEPGWVLGTISKPVQHCSDRFQLTQMKLHELTQLGWGDMANNFRHRHKKYGSTELMVPALV